MDFSTTTRKLIFFNKVPNVIKFSSVGSNNSLRKGNSSLGTNSVSYGPTSTTGFFNGINPPPGGWVLYQERTGTDYNNFGPSILVFPNDSSFIGSIASQSGTNITTLGGALDWVRSQNSLMALNNNYWNIVTDQLGLMFDGNQVSSYPQTGSVLYDLSGNSLNVNSANVQVSSGRYCLFSNGNNADTNSSNLLNIDTHTIQLNLKFKGDVNFPQGYSGNWNQFLGYFGGGTDRSPGIWRFPSLKWIHWTYNPGNTSVNFGKNSAGDEFDLNKDYNVCMVKNGGTATAYVNGVAIVTASVVNPKTEGNSILRFFGGYPADLMDITSCFIYRKALSESEVLQNYYLGPVVTTNMTNKWDIANVVSYPGGGTPLYNLSNGVNATLINGPTYSSNFGGYLSYDGSDDYVELLGGNYAITLGNGDVPWTVNAWVRTTTAADSLGQGSVLSNSSGGPVYSMLGVNGGKITYWVYPSNINSWKVFKGNTTVNDGEWHMLTWVQYSNSTMDMYVDGVFDFFASPTNASNNNPIDRMGGSWAGVFSGDIADVQINTISFTSTQVRSQFEATRMRYGK